jgi:hypothetical protein
MVYNTNAEEHLYIFDDDNDMQKEAFGYAILNGDMQNAEFGYMNIDEIYKCYNLPSISTANDLKSSGIIKLCI